MCGRGGVVDAATMTSQRCCVGSTGMPSPQGLENGLRVPQRRVERKTGGKSLEAENKELRARLEALEVNAEEQGSQVQQRMSEKDLYQIHQVDFPWKRMLHWGTCEGERVEGTICKEEKEKRNSQGKDPRTFEENGQGGDLITHETNSRGRDPRTLKKGGELRKKRKEEKWKKRKKKKKKKGEAQKKLVEKSAKKGSQASWRRRGKKKRKKRKAKRKTDVPEKDKSRGSLEDGSFSFCYWSRIGCVSMLQRKDCREDGDGKDAAARSPSEREQMDGWRRIHKGGDSQKEQTGLI